ncbi:MAG TPA: protease complex subunit PrcB family protein [Gammaproteobacteria bacterium]|jgi:hypothetical protein
MKKLSIALAASLALLAGCASDGGGSSESAATILQAGSHSGLKDQTEKDIHNQADLESMWNQIFANQSSTKPPLPVVDFTKTTVAVYGVGEMKTGGWTIRVDRAEPTTGGYAVGFTVNKPGNNCSRSGNEVTDPFIIITVPTALPITFDEVKSHQIPPCT